MTETPKKYYDLEERTYQFAKDVRAFTEKLIRTVENIEDIRQLVRASGSVAANYIEANEALSKKDFIYRIKICRKEAKESQLFLRLLDIDNKNEYENERIRLVNEAMELVKIFNSIAEKSEKGVKSIIEK
jgi:four helix bundle protein